MIKWMGLAIVTSGALLAQPVIFATAGDLTEMVHAARQTDRSMPGCRLTSSLKYDFAGKPYWKKVRICT